MAGEGLCGGSLVISKIHVGKQPLSLLRTQVLPEPWPSLSTSGMYSFECACLLFLAKISSRPWLCAPSEA